LPSFFIAANREGPEGRIGKKEIFSCRLVVLLLLLLLLRLATSTSPSRANRYAGLHLGCRGGVQLRAEVAKRQSVPSLLPFDGPKVWELVASLIRATAPISLQATSHSSSIIFITSTSLLRSQSTPTDLTHLARRVTSTLCRFLSTPSFPGLPSSPYSSSSPS
jgi:hypothetical protein